MTQQATETNAYDRVPYNSFPFPQTHPDRLATIATLFGFNPADVSNARILELGCASGGNLLPMADQFPEAAFLGVDYSRTQIETGEHLLKESGLGNVRLERSDIRDYLPGEKFDYIIVHGVYSWVSDDIQKRILELIRESLSPNGLAYVSYNTYPGWHMRGMIREIMRFRANKFDTPEDQLSQARGLLAFLSQSITSEKNPYGLLLKNELESMNRTDDSYLMHEHLEDINTPIYFHQFAGRLEQHELKYVGEADFGVMSSENFPEPVQGMLKSVAQGRIETEQYMDFLRNRAFRQTIICHQNQQLSLTSDPQQLGKMRVASNAKAEQNDYEIHSKNQLKLQRRNSFLNTSEPIVKAAFLQLKNAWPASIPFPQLTASSLSAVAGRPIPIDTAAMSEVSLQLARTFLRCYATSMVDLHISQPSFVNEVTENPGATKLARAQAESGSHVTNRRHERLTLDDIQRFVLRQMNFKTPRDEILDRVCKAVEEGELVLYQADGEKIQKPDHIRSAVQELVPQVAKSLARQALLVQ